MSTQHIKQVAIAAIAVLAMSVTAFAQDDQRRRGRDRGDAAEAATEAFGFTQEQVDKIRDIRRERPPRGQSSEERQAWSAEQQAKVEAVLTEEQKAKIADLNEMREKMRDFAIAARMGLVDAGGRGRDSARARDRRGGNRVREGRGRRGPSRGRGASRGRGPDRSPGSNRGGRRTRRGGRAENVGPQFAQARRARAVNGPFAR
ncbi:MAG: hypothetical protein OXH83_22715 [Bryobacterales bacterium]|nr:hypothetical protein [Bryobacterales bacterium]